MFQALRRHANVTTIVSVLALVFAMTGGAYAAKHYLITSTKQISPKVLKQLKGKRGPAGPEGKQGAPGPQGPAGKNGTNGVNGTNGTSGVNGENVTMKAASPSECKEGGSAFTVSGKTEHVCNGSPWTAGGVLPKGASETGTWAAPILKPAALPFGLAQGAISFNVPLRSAPTMAFVNEAGEEAVYNETKPAENGEPAEFAWSSFGAAKNCLGNLTEPTAKEGFLCVYAQKTVGAELGGTSASYAVGATITLIKGAEGFSAVGTWAVTSKG